MSRSYIGHPTCKKFFSCDKQKARTSLGVGFADPWLIFSANEWSDDGWYLGRKGRGGSSILLRGSKNWGYFTQTKTFLLTRLTQVNLSQYMEFHNLIYLPLLAAKAVMLAHPFLAPIERVFSMLQRLWLMNKEICCKTTGERAIAQDKIIKIIIKFTLRS